MLQTLELTQSFPPLRAGLHLCESHHCFGRPCAAGPGLVHAHISCFGKASKPARASLLAALSPCLWSMYAVKPASCPPLTMQAYGQTGSGKTHTMLGTPSDQGMIPRAMEQVQHSTPSTRTRTARPAAWTFRHPLGGFAPSNLRPPAAALPAPNDSTGVCGGRRAGQAGVAVRNAGQHGGGVQRGVQVPAGQGGAGREEAPGKRRVVRVCGRDWERGVAAGGLSRTGRRDQTERGELQ